jgi:hypothetical protein
MENFDTCKNHSGESRGNKVKDVSRAQLSPRIKSSKRIKFRQRFADEGFESFHSSDNGSSDCEYFSGEVLKPRRECTSISTSRDVSPYSLEDDSKSASNEETVREEAVNIRDQ